MFPGKAAVFPLNFATFCQEFTLHVLTEDLKQQRQI